MAETREERRFAEVSRDSIKLMAESAGVELPDELASMLAEDVCYRLREATQVNTRAPYTLHQSTLTAEHIASLNTHDTYKSLS